MVGRGTRPAKGAGGRGGTGSPPHGTPQTCTCRGRCRSVRTTPGRATRTWSAVRERTPSAPITSRAVSSRRRGLPARGRRLRVTLPSSRRTTSVTIVPVINVAPARTAASARMASRTERRARAHVDACLVLDRQPERSVSPLAVLLEKDERTGGAPLSSTSPSGPHRDSWTTPPRTSEWVEVVSLGSRARSSSRTSWPARASSMAVAAPAARDPTTMTSWSLPTTSRNGGRGQHRRSFGRGEAIDLKVRTAGGGRHRCRRPSCRPGRGDST